MADSNPIDDYGFPRLRVPKRSVDRGDWIVPLCHPFQAPSMLYDTKLGAEFGTAVIAQAPSTEVNYGQHLEGGYAPSYGSVHLSYGGYLAQ